MAELATQFLCKSWGAYAVSTFVCHSQPYCSVTPLFTLSHGTPVGLATKYTKQGGPSDFQNLCTVASNSTLATVLALLFLCLVFTTQESIRVVKAVAGSHGRGSSEWRWWIWEGEAGKSFKK